MSRYRVLFNRILVALLVSSSCLIPSVLRALVKERGMGDVGTAYPQSAVSANFNPAGITEVEDQLDVNPAVLYQNGRNYIKGSQDPMFNQSASSTQAKYVPAGSAGICKKLTPVWSAGLSLDATRPGKGSQKPFPQFGHGRHQGVDVVIGILVPTLAWKVNKCHSVGMSLPVIFSRFKLNGLQNLAANSISPENVSNRGYNWAYGFGLRFGWLWRMTSRWTFGVYYSPHLLTASHHHKYKGFIPLKGKLEVQPVLRLGLAYQWGRAHIVGEIECNFFKLVRTLHNSPFSKALHGSKKGPSLGWDNSVTGKLGMDYLINDQWTVRSGCGVRMPPFVKSSTTIANFLSPSFIIKYYLTTGATYQLNCNTEISVAYIYNIHRYLRGKRLPELANGHLDIEYEAHALWIGIAKFF